MVDAEPDKYRPRRAFVEPDASPAPPSPKPAGPPEPLDEDTPKPLFRDEVSDPDPDATSPSATSPSATSPSSSSTSSNATSPGTTSPAPAGDGDPGSRGTRPITFTPKRTRSADDDDSTTILPRTGSGRRGGEVDAIDDLADDEHRTLGRRTKIGLLVAAVAAVVVVGLAVGYSVLRVNDTTTGVTPTISAGTSAGPTVASPEPSAALLGDDVLLSTGDAALVGGGTWKVASTERETTADSPVPACFTADPVEGAPTPEQRVIRLLSSTGKNAPGLLHEATAYATPEDAAQAYAVAAKTLGSCEVAGSYIFSGQTVTGVGDQAVGVIVTSVTGGTTSEHSLILSRTGRVMNIVDATKPNEKIAPGVVAKASAAVVGRECATAGGACGGTAAVKDGPPPVGGDEPGFLATGDLPPAGKTPMPWVATPPELPKEDFLGSQCETVNWSTLSTESTTSRIYIVQDSGNFFGLNEIVATMKDDDAATKLAAKIKDDWNSCEKRKLTAKVSDPGKVKGTGAQKSEVAGWTTEITQRSTDGTKKYRAGVVAVGTKVAYTFLNPQGGFDFTDSQFDTVAVRAGQRTTQVN